MAHDIKDVAELVKDFYPFAKERYGLVRDPKIFFEQDDINAEKALGKTAHYSPVDETITVYVTDRHPKDILRSFSHELVHHAQNCRGEFEGKTEPAGESGYAQKD